MGQYASEVKVYNANGLHLADGGIGFDDTDALNAGDVGSLANGAEGSFWVSQASAQAYLGQAGGATLTLNTAEV